MYSTFEDLYPFFLSKLIDYNYGELSQEEFDAVMTPYIKSAVSKFKSLDNVTVNSNNKCFNRILTDEEMEILSMFLISAWMSKQVYNIESFQNTLSSKDYSIYSEANLLKEKIATKQLADNDALYWAKQYSIKKVKKKLGN